MKSIKCFSFLLIVFLFSAGFAFAQDSRQQKHSHNHNMEMKKDKSDTSMKQDTSIVREGVIDLQTIDKNKDGKVYQDTMDWNVISDEPGKCPLCDMKLKEVSHDQAKENLIKHDFKVKE